MQINRWFRLALTIAARVIDWLLEKSEEALEKKKRKEESKYETPSDEAP